MSWRLMWCEVHLIQQVGNIVKALHRQMKEKSIKTRQGCFSLLTELILVIFSRIKKIWSYDNRFEVNWPPEATLVLRWISKFFLFGALPSDTLKIKHAKNLKEIPSRHVLENLLEKSKHSCLYTTETHWQFTGILPIYNGRHAKSHNSRL